MTQLSPVILFLFLILSVVAWKLRWQSALLLFLVGPLLGITLIFCTELIANLWFGQIGIIHLRDLPSFFLFTVTIEYFYAASPHGALIASLTIFAGRRMRYSAADATPTLRKTVAASALLGGGVGLLFGLTALVVTHIFAGDRTVAIFLSGGTFHELRMNDELFLSVSVGLADGILITLFGLRESSNPGFSAKPRTMSVQSV